MRWRRRRIQRWKKSPARAAWDADAELRAVRDYRLARALGDFGVNAAGVATAFVQMAQSMFQARSAFEAMGRALNGAHKAAVKAFEVMR